VRRLLDKDGVGKQTTERGAIKRKKRARTTRMEIRRDPITQSWVVLGHR